MRLPVNAPAEDYPLCLEFKMCVCVRCIRNMIKCFKSNAVNYTVKSPGVIVTLLNPGLIT